MVLTVSLGLEGAITCCAAISRLQVSKTAISATMVNFNRKSSLFLFSLQFEELFYNGMVKFILSRCKAHSLYPVKEQSSLSL